MDKNINIGTESKNLDQLWDDAVLNERENDFTEIDNKAKLSLVQNLFTSTENITVKRTIDGDKAVFVFYDNNLPKYYISEENLIKYYELEAGEQGEIAKESKIHELMLKILLLKMYSQTTTELEKELIKLQEKEKSESKDKTKLTKKEVEDLKKAVKLSSTNLLSEIENPLNFYKDIKKKSSRFIRNMPFDGISYGPEGKKTLKNMRNDAKEYIENMRNKKKLLQKQPELLDLGQIKKDIQRYINQQDSFTKDRTSATNQERVDTTSPDVNNTDEAEKENRNLKRRAEYLQEYATKLRETGMRKFDIRQKDDLVNWLGQIVNGDIDEIVKNGVVINPLVINYLDDYNYLCKTYPRITEFINYKEITKTNNPNTGKGTKGGSQGKKETTSTTGTGNIERVKGNTTVKRFGDAYAKGGFGGMSSQIFDEVANVLGRKNNSREYHQAKKFIGTTAGLIGFAYVGRQAYKLTRDKVAANIPVLKNAPGLSAVALLLGGEFIAQGLTSDQSGIVSNLRGAFMGNKQSKKHKEFIGNFIEGYHEDKENIEQDHDRIQTVIGDIPVSILTNTTSPLIKMRDNKIFLEYNNLKSYIEEGKAKGNLTSFEYDDKIEALKYFDDDDNQNLVPTTLVGLGISSSVLNDPQNATKTINELILPVTGNMVESISKHFETKKMIVSGTDLEYVKNRKRIENHYIKNHKTQSISQMMLVRETNKRIISKEAQIDQEDARLELKLKTKVKKTLETLGDYKLSEISPYFTTSSSIFDIEAMIAATSDTTKKAALQNKLVELKKLRTAYEELPEKIIGDALLEMGISDTIMSTKPDKKVKEFYIERKNTFELKKLKKRREKLLEDYETENYLTHTENDPKIEAIIDNSSLIKDADINLAFKNLNKNNPGVFKFDYRKDSYLRLNRDGSVDTTTKTNIDALTPNPKLTTKEKGIMAGVMEVTNKNVSIANFKYVMKGADIAVETYGETTKLDISKNQLVNFPVGSNATNAITFSSTAELLLTTYQINKNKKFLKGTSTLEKPFNKARRSGNIEFSNKSTRESLVNLTETEILSKLRTMSHAEIARMAGSYLVGGFIGWKAGGLIFKNKAVLNALAKLAGSSAGAYGALKIFSDTRILEGMANMTKTIVTGGLSDQTTENAGNLTKTIAANKGAYVNYLNSIKTNTGNSIRQNSANYKTSSNKSKETTTITQTPVPLDITTTKLKYLKSDDIKIDRSVSGAPVGTKYKITVLDSTGTPVVNYNNKLTATDATSITIPKNILPFGKHTIKITADDTTSHSFAEKTIDIMVQKQSVIKITSPTTPTITNKNVTIERGALNITNAEKSKTKFHYKITNIDTGNVSEIDKPGTETRVTNGGTGLVIGNYKVEITGTEPDYIEFQKATYTFEVK